jgi:hypothetical protein
MAESQINAGPKAIGCETCDRMGWDDSSWSKWTEPGSNARTCHVCHKCLWSRRSYWIELFSFRQKLGVGTTHIPPKTLSSSQKAERI